MLRRRVFLLILSLSFIQAPLQAFPNQAAQIIQKVTANYLQIRDASCDLTLDYNLSLLGCGGNIRQMGTGYYRAPDKLKVTLNKVVYFARGNQIRKIDEKNRYFYITLIHAPDFSPGFHPGLITHNFNISLEKQLTHEAEIKGLPKPGLLPNVKEIFFYIDTQRSLLTGMDVKFTNPRLPGQLKIDYQQIKGLWVPVAMRGNSAIEVAGGILVSLKINLQAQNMRVNTGLPAKLFDPGF